MRRVQDREVGLEAHQLGRVQAEEHVVREERVPRALADDPDVDPVRRILAGARVLHEEIALVQEVDDVRTKRLVVLGR